MTPPASALAARSYEHANRVALRYTKGRRISHRAWALRENIALAERLATSDQRIIGTHPEVSFRELCGTELQWARSSWNGQQVRRSALAHAGIELPDYVREGGEVAAADLLDAAVAAWTAHRYEHGTARSFPARAHHGQRGVIWR